MKTEVTRTVVTLVEVHTRETGDATVKGVSKVSDVSGEWYADDETPVVESEGDELCIYVDGTTIYLSEIETEKICLIVD